MYEHKRSIEKFGSVGITPTPVSIHFNEECRRPAKFNFQILETLRGDTSLTRTTDHRRNKEKWWILNLRTVDPLGMNAFI